MISEKLNETNPALKRSFYKAIKENDDFAMFRYLGVDVTALEGGGLKIGTYRPSFTLSKNSGITVPYSMFGLNEDILLKNVEVIEGNLILNNKNHLFDSRISVFPPNLEKVTGKIHCTAAQYEKFGADIDRVVGNNKAKVVIYNR